MATVIELEGRANWLATIQPLNGGRWVCVMDCLPMANGERRGAYEHYADYDGHPAGTTNTYDRSFYEFGIARGLCKVIRGELPPF